MHGRCPPLQVVNPLCCGGSGGGDEADEFMGDKIYREGRFSRTMTLALRRIEALEKGIRHLPSGGSEDSVVGGESEDSFVGGESDMDDDAESDMDEETFDIDV